VSYRSILVRSAVAVFKITLGICWIANLFRHVGEAANSKRKSLDRIFSLALAGLLVWLLSRMINGKRVYAARGWALPGTP